MKIRGKKEVEVEISEEEMGNITINYLYDLFDWGTNYKIVDGEVWGAKINHGLKYQKLRSASEEDFEFEQFLKCLKRVWLRQLQEKED